MCIEVANFSFDRNIQVFVLKIRCYITAYPFLWKSDFSNVTMFKDTQILSVINYHINHSLAISSQ